MRKPASRKTRIMAWLSASTNARNALIPPRRAYASEVLEQLGADAAALVERR